MRHIIKGAWGLLCVWAGVAYVREAVRDSREEQREREFDVEHAHNRINAAQDRLDAIEQREAARSLAKRDAEEAKKAAGAAAVLP